MNSLPYFRGVDVLIGAAWMLILGLAKGYEMGRRRGRAEADNWWLNADLQGEVGRLQIPRPEPSKQEERWP